MNTYNLCHYTRTISDRQNINVTFNNLFMQIYSFDTIDTLIEKIKIKNTKKILLINTGFSTGSIITTIKNKLHKNCEEWQIYGIVFYGFNNFNFIERSSNIYYLKNPNLYKLIYSLSNIFKIKRPVTIVLSKEDLVNTIIDTNIHDYAKILWNGDLKKGLLQVIDFTKNLKSLKKYSHEQELLTLIEKLIFELRVIKTNMTELIKTNRLEFDEDTKFLIDNSTDTSAKLMQLLKR